jgi:hypothetical protein
MMSFAERWRLAVETKPHIFLSRGYWRVTPMPKPAWRNADLWVKAHRFVARLNGKRQMERLRAEWVGRAMPVAWPAVERTVGYGASVVTPTVLPDVIALDVIEGSLRFGRPTAKSEGTDPSQNT